MVWEAIFLLLILKIPLVYLCFVIWWAIKAEPAPPEPMEPSLVTVPPDPDPRSGWRFLRRRTRPKQPRRGPHGPPQRVHRRAPLPASWQAAGWKGPEE
jgi:hypothetical protein